MTAGLRVLVTGGAGFIGSEYVRSLLSGGLTDAPVESVTVFDKLTYAGNLENLSPVAHDHRFRFVRGDICDGASLSRELTGNDLVVNFAAETHVDRSIVGPQEFVRTNVLGVQVLLDACLRAGTDRIVHIGTDEVYGSIETGSWNEDSPLLPNSPYSAAKAAAELLARAYHRTYGLNISTTRCSNNYGPYQFPEKLIPLFVTNLILGRRVPLYGDGLNVRDWIHVHDHCRGVQLVAERGEPGRAYNIGGGVELTNLELTNLILEAFAADESAIEYVTDRKGHDRRYSVDDTAIRELGYEPSVPFEDGLAETIGWFRSNEAWWRPLREARGP
jgi:dTDP-glucose 4,6-dehydratase